MMLNLKEVVQGAMVGFTGAVIVAVSSGSQLPAVGAIASGFLGASGSAVVQKTQKKRKQYVLNHKGHRTLKMVYPEDDR